MLTISVAVKSDQLPISPRLTPAFGFAGIALMFSGLVYTFIGSKFKWLHASLSAAFLGALSVTVLIVHVSQQASVSIMSISQPPMSNVMQLATSSTSDAVQGGFFVAIIVTGLVLGGLSYFFCNVTEGLASLLGGFCFSMWLLVMRPGGLIHSAGGRTAFIVVFTIFGYATTCQSVTRDYSMLVGIALSGATAVSKF